MDQHTGLFVAFWLTKDIANRLAFDGGEAADQLHCTLLYCGDVAALGAEVVDKAIAAVMAIARDTVALQGRISGLGRFNASETSDGYEILYASVDMPGLVELRVRLAAALTEAGAPPGDDHGYDPHVTLCCLSPGDAGPINTTEPIALEFDELTIIAGDRRFEIQLSSPQEGMKMDNPHNPVKFSDTSTAKDVIEGIGIPFGGPFNGKDLHKQFFSTKTEFAFNWFAERPLLYAHGFDEEIKLDVVGRVKQWAVKGGKGVWVQCQLDQSKEYFDDIKTLIDQDKLYFSSGSVDHLVEVNRKTGEIEQWPWIELTLTPRPANLFATLDFADAVKHCKDAGIEMPGAVKEALTRRAKDLSIDGIFERELAEENNSVWRIWNAANRAFEEVAKAVSVESITGVTIDITAQVTAIVIAFNARLIPAVVAQIQDYKQNPCDERSFYIKTVSLDELIDDNSRVGLPFASHLEQVRAAVVGVTKRADELFALRTPTKEGRTYSAANLSKLQGLHAQIGEAHGKMGELIDAGKPKPKDDEPAKSAKARDRKLRLLNLESFQLGSE
jgi:2'-5' RNA ligase